MEMEDTSRTAEVRNFISRELQQLARSLEDHRTENCLEQLDSIVHILVEFELIEQHDTILEDVICLVQQAGRTLQEEYEGIPYATQSTQPPLHKTSRRGRLCFDIPKDTLVYFVENGVTVSKMAEIIGVSPRTIKNRLQEYDLSVRSTYSQISDDELDQMVAKKVREFPDSGYRTVTGHLRADGFRIQYDRVQESMRRNFPLEVIARKLYMQTKRIQRRRYSVKAPMSLWHVDTNHKLIRWRFVFHAGIDGYSRLPTYIVAASDNTADMALKAFLSGVKEYGLPYRVRSDKGKENVKIAEFMLCQRGVESNPHITGRSVHNQRIERFWREVWQGCTKSYYHLFMEMEEQLILDVDSELHLLALHLVFLGRLQQSVKRFCLAVSRRPLRTEGNKTPLQLWILGQALDARVSLAVDEVAEYGVDFGGPVDMNFDCDIVVPSLWHIPDGIAVGVNEIINSRATEDVFEKNTYLSVVEYLVSQTDHHPV